MLFPSTKKKSITSKHLKTIIWHTKTENSVMKADLVYVLLGCWILAHTEKEALLRGAPGCVES